MQSLIRFSPEAFLSAVEEELQHLPPRKRRPVMNRLITRLEDAATAYRESGLTLAVALEKAVVEMGDPGQLGRRLCQEQLAKGLPLGEAMVAGAPGLVVPLGYLATVVTTLLLMAGIASKEAPPAWIPWAPPVFGAAGALAVGLWGLRSGYKLWLATLSGCLVLPASIILPSVARVTLPFEAAVGLALSPLALSSLIPRSGGTVSSFAILGAVTFFSQLAWVMQDGPVEWYGSLLLFVPYAGLAVVGVAPRARRAATVWAVFAVDWLIIGLVALRSCIQYSTFSMTPGSISLQAFLTYFPLTLFLGSAVALLASQALPRLPVWLRRQRCSLKVSALTGRNPRPPDTETRAVNRECEEQGPVEGQELTADRRLWHNS